ncbi:hypothetical protein AW736_17205, partial [Termitidicoccus mucosus]
LPLPPPTSVPVRFPTHDFAGKVCRHWHHCLTFFLLLLVLSPRSFSAEPASDPALTALAQKAAGESSPAARAKARGEFISALRSPELSIDARLHHAWTAVLLAETDDERRAILKIAAAIPDARARMLVAAFRDYPYLRKDYASADKALAQLLAPGAATTDAKGKRIPPREIFGPNPFDTPALFDKWEHDGFSGRWADKDGLLAVEVVLYPQNNYKARVLRRGDTPLPLVGFAQPDGSLLLLGPGERISDGRNWIVSARLPADGRSAFSIQLNTYGTSLPLALDRAPLGKVFPEKRPADAVVLLDATTGLRHFRQANGSDARWLELPGGVIEIDPVAGSIFSRREFGDARIYLEFRHALNPGSLGARRGNSGVYVMNTYEVQLVDSFGEEPDEVSEGAVYHIAIPAAYAVGAPLEWQSMEIEFRAPRFDAAGNKTAGARMTVWQNGIKIHDDIEVPNPTAASAATGRKLKDKQPPQPLMLQNHGNRVQFRNIWVAPLPGS